ncbi:hypothetical protein LguiB_023214 [Lonicera macranthoides]
MDFTRKLSFLVFILCVLISLKNQNAETRKGGGSSYSPSSYPPASSFDDINAAEEENNKVEEADEDYQQPTLLQYNFYQQSCPNAEHIIRSTVHRLYPIRSQDMPALLRLVFHDCFIEGCDASVLLDAADGIESEKESPPNQSLRGFDLIDIIKQEVEEECPGIVSYTGRRDSTVSFPEIATLELPSPQDNLSDAIASFASKGFDERETVSLLGAHSTGMIHCKFFVDRLYNFSGNNEPDPSIDIEFLKVLRAKCNNSLSASHDSSPSPSLSPSLSPSSSIDVSVSSSSLDDGLKLEYEGPGSSFGTLYYRNLLQNRGILYVDQQLTAGEETETWVRAYASDSSLLRRDFALAMMKLSSYRVLTAPMGQVRLNCRRVLSES